MTVKELIKQLKSVKNQNARVDIYVPYMLENDCADDYCTDKFEIHRANDNDNWIEFYCTEELKTFSKP